MRAFENALFGSAVLVALLASGCGRGKIANPKNGPQPKVVSFTALAPYLTQSTALAVSLGDIDGDSIQDFAVSLADSIDSPRIEVALGNGDGTFSAAIKSYMPAGPAHDLAPGDLDGDGWLDLGANTSTSAVLLYGRGDGYFDATPIAADVNFVFSQGSVAVCDLNGDGLDDYACVRADSMLAFMGAGDRIHGRIASYAPPGPTSNGSVSSVAEDFNGDANQDFAMPRIDSGQVAIYYGLGTGSFQLPVLLAVSSQPQRTAVLGSPSGSAGGLAVALADSGVGVLRWSGGTSQPAEVYKLGAGGSGVAAADFNSDGHVDLVTSIPLTNNVGVLLGDANGVFGSPQYFSVGPLLGDTKSADFNGDGAPDLAVVGLNAVYILMNTSK